MQFPELNAIDWSQWLPSPAEDADLRRSSPTAPWRSVDLSPLPNVIGMTQPDELKYLYWACQTQFTGRGRVVELGPFLGRTTVAMVAGLRNSTRPHTRVVSLDSHRWNHWGIEVFGTRAFAGLSAEQKQQLTPRHLTPQDNDSFRWLFDLYTESFRDNIEAHSVDLDEYHWTGEPIDILFIDAAKSWKTLDHILMEFFPHLVDGALVIHQDYKHYFTYWLLPPTERMVNDGVLVPTDNVNGTPSQAFRFNRRPDFDVRRYLQETFTPPEIVQLLRQAISRFPSEDSITVASAAINYLKGLGRLREAKQLFLATLARGGFSDGWALNDFLQLGSDWHRRLRDTFCETGRLSWPNDSVRLMKVGPNGAGIWCAHPGQNVQLLAAVAGPGVTNQLIMQVVANPESTGAIRTRLVVRQEEGGATLFSEQWVLQPGETRPVAVTFSRGSLSLECETEFLGPERGMGVLTLLNPILSAGEADSCCRHSCEAA